MWVDKCPGDMFNSVSQVHVTALLMFNVEHQAVNKKSRRPTMNPNIAAAVEQSQQTTARLKEIGKALSTVEKEKAKILSEEEALNAELAQLTGSTISTSQSSGRKGRKPGSKNKKSGAKAKSSTSSTKRGGSETGETREEIMLRTMPTGDEGAVGKQEIHDRLEKSGFTSKAADPIVGVGQSLFKMKKQGLVTNKEGGRGEWCLTKSGIKARDKQLAEATKAAESSSE